MTTANRPATKLLAYCKCLGLYYAVVAILMLLPFFLNTANVQWLPSPAFALKIRVVALMVAYATSLSCLLMFRHIDRIRHVDKNRRNRPDVLLLCLFLAVSGYYSTITTVPLVAAMLAGDDTEMAFVVKDVTPYRVRYCGYAVELEDLSPHYGTLCNFPPEFTEGIKPGTQIVVTGRGTSRGLFVASARVAPQEVSP